MKNRKKKAEEYEVRYLEIPKDFYERLNWMCDRYNIKESKYADILNKKDNMLSNMYYSVYKIILYEEPEGSPRPRFRLVNRHSLLQEAVSNSFFVHVYSITGAQDRNYMKRLVSTDELYQLDSIIYTACDVDYYAFLRTPSYFNTTDKFLAEIGLIRPIAKPDWDNIGKKYSDMYNGNVWIDDECVIEGRVGKYYSILPRVEITLKFLNALYHKNQYMRMSKRLDKPIAYYDNKGNVIQGDVNI